MAADLHKHLPAILADLEHGKVRREYREALIDHIERTVRASAGRAGSGPANSKQNSQRRRDAVQQAAQQIARERPGLGQRERISLIRRRAHGILNKDLSEGRKPYAKPSRWLVADVLGTNKSIAKFGTESTRTPRYAVDMAATCCST